MTDEEGAESDASDDSGVTITRSRDARKGRVLLQCRGFGSRVKFFFLLCNLLRAIVSCSYLDKVLS